MYLIPITVPIYRDGPTLSIASDWFRALELLRDSLAGRYGHLCVAAPWLPAGESEQLLRVPDIGNDGIELMPLFDNRVRLRDYWLRGVHRQAIGAAARRFPEVQVVHGTVEEPLRPYCYSIFMNAMAHGLPGVFVQDQDVVETLRRLHARDALPRRAMIEIETRAHEYQCRRAIAAAGVSFLKGRTTLRRYAHCSPHIHAFDDASYLAAEIVDRNMVEARLASLLAGRRPLRFGFSGRLVDIKGVDRSLRIIHAARAAGADVAMDIIGSGPEEPVLHALAAQLGLRDDIVRFVGAMEYGPALLKRLAQCDALLFNPRMEETPRMIFDGYAAGLPLVAGGIAYVRERVESDAAGIVLPRDDDEAAARRIVEIDRERAALVPLTHAALKAAAYHAADAWYARRAQWTHEMVARHRLATRV